jgi:hypothetical protein
MVLPANTTESEFQPLSAESRERKASYTAYSSDVVSRSLSFHKYPHSPANVQASTTVMVTDKKRVIAYFPIIECRRHVSKILVELFTKDYIFPTMITHRRHIKLDFGNLGGIATSGHCPENPLASRPRLCQYPSVFPSRRSKLVPASRLCEISFAYLTCHF